jgi:DNA-binding NtrC family response regulator
MKNLSRISAEAEQMLGKYDFPGNVRQLENMIQQAVVLSDGPVLEWESLQFFEAGPARKNGHTVPTSSGREETIETAVGQVEKEMIQKALAAVRGKRQEAAKFLNISRKSLYNKMKKYGMMD